MAMGNTTREILNTLLQKRVEAYRAELEKLPFKKQVREMLIDGFRDGCRDGINQTVALLEIEVQEIKAEKSL